MKFKIADIKPLIHVDSSPITLDFDWIKEMLAKMQDEYGLDLNPDFQRSHVWKYEQKQKFIEYILRGGVVPPIRFNSPCFGGHRKSKHCDLPDTVILVDGKQRLNACIEFLDDKIDVFGGHFLSDFDNVKTLTRKTGISYTVNKLQTKAEVLQWYLEMNEGQVAHTTEELERVKIMLLKEMMK